MWCSTSRSSPFPPLPLLLPPRSMTSPLCFLLTRWSSHRFRCFLQVLLRRLSPVTPRGLYPARVPRCHLPARPLRLTRVPGRHLRHRYASPSRCVSTSDVLPTWAPGRRLRLRPHHRHVTPSRCASTSDVPGWRRCLRRRRWPPLRRGHLRHRRRLLRRQHRPRRRGIQLLGPRRRCTTHRSFTDTRVMFTRW
jgi:hypothetical protein